MQNSNFSVKLGNSMKHEQKYIELHFWLFCPHYDLFLSLGTIQKKVQSWKKKYKNNVGHGKNLSLKYLHAKDNCKLNIFELTDVKNAVMHLIKHLLKYFHNWASGITSIQSLTPSCSDNL